MKTVGPTTKTKAASAMASTMLMLESHWMPLATPETAESTNATVSRAMIATSTRVAVAADAADDLQAAADLQGAEAERGGRAEEGREDREHVDDLAGRAVGTRAEERLEGGADQLDATLAVGAVRDREADDGVDRPGVQRPVEERGGHGGLRAARRARARRGCGEVADRLADAVEHQADAHPGAEHHRDPRDGAELRLLVVAAQRDVAEPAHREPDHEDDERRRGQHEDPPRVGHRPRQALARTRC